MFINGVPSSTAWQYILLLVVCQTDQRGVRHQCIFGLFVCFHYSVRTWKLTCLFSSSVSSSSPSSKLKLYLSRYDLLLSLKVYLLVSIVQSTTAMIGLTQGQSTVPPGVVGPNMTDTAAGMIWTRKLSRVMIKPTKWMCAQRRLWSAWASAQSDQSLRCALNG